MGESKVSQFANEEDKHLFVKHLLNDMKAMEYMLKNDWFEDDIMRIGAEQEMVIVDNHTFKPAPISMEVIEAFGEKEWLDTELAKFNLETNLSPRLFSGQCLSEMHEENASYLNQLQEALDEFDAHILLTGILPTLHKHDLEYTNLTPKIRYKLLMDSINELHGNRDYHLNISGIDELKIKHNSPLLEACNTSFQVHIQVSSREFANMYNIAQALTAPVLAISVNSPLVFGRRLWHESRIAMFQQSIDTRQRRDHLREQVPRVHFGKNWVSDSILELYQEDISRFRVLLTSDLDEDSLEMIDKGVAPKLKALQLHNGTVYRWNRPCYGISASGKPHLRIENRILPAGPTVQDEIANAAFWLGLMVGMREEIPDIRTRMKFEYAKDNFSKAARYGLDAKFTWLDNEILPSKELILDRLLPMARKGLEHQKVDSKDIDTYLGIIEGRATSGSTGARWMIDSYTDLLYETSKDEALTTLSSSIAKYQRSKTPVHLWQKPTLEDLTSYKPAYLRVSEFMLTDLVTVQKDDLLSFVAQMMNWKNLRYVLVEDESSKLLGLITDKLILKAFLDGNDAASCKVSDIMITDIVTIAPEADIIEAIDKMRENQIGCLPVIRKDEIAGLITTMEFLQISTSLLQRFRKK